MPEKTKEGRTVQLKVRADLLESKGVEKAPKVVAYAFSSGGQLLGNRALDANGTAILELPGSKEAGSVRVLVGPEVEAKEDLITAILRRGAEERHVRIDPDNLTPSVDIAVIPNKWRCWLLGLCFVRGTLLKRIVSGGIPINFPVCNATVNIYEVDPIRVIITRLPDLAIERIRDLIINPPPPPSPPDDGIIRLFTPPGGELIRSMSSGSPEGGARSFSQPVLGAEMGRMAMAASAGSKTSSTSEPASFSQSSGSSIQFLAKTTNTPQFRQVLMANVESIRHIFCLLPISVTTTLVATATTDECGHFQAVFFRGCNNPDTPDLYFTAKQFFTIYAPTPIPCFTYWNYVCGTEVTLHTTSPFAITCPPCPPVIAPDDWVLVWAIGNHPLSRIHGTSDQLQPTTDTTNFGLAHTNLTTAEGASVDVPWGGLLRPRIEFDNRLRANLGVKYYRVYWRKGTTDAFKDHPLTDEVHRHYSHVVGPDVVSEVYPLGPKVINNVPNLFEIPPALPPIGQWSIPDAVEDTTSAKFPTGDFAPADKEGTYQLKVDLFDANGALVDITALGIKYRVPHELDLSAPATIHTDDAAALGLVFDEDGDGKKSFIMTLHIDNNVCSSSLAPPTLNGSPANPCGVMNYDPKAPGSVTMDYTASHPHGFATYTFGLYRGGTLLTPPTVFNQPVGAGSFSVTQTVNYLLGGCPVAGFAEYLNVWALAIDGWRRLSEYDTLTIARGFVLAPM